MVVGITQVAPRGGDHMLPMIPPSLGARKGVMKEWG